MDIGAGLAIINWRDGVGGATNGRCSVWAEVKDPLQGPFHAKTTRQHVTAQPLARSVLAANNAYMYVRLQT